MSGAYPRTIQQTHDGEVAAPELLASLPTDCDFRPSASAAHDRAILDRAGIRRVVVNLADWPDANPQRFGRAARAIVDAAAFQVADIAALHDKGVRGVRVGVATAADLGALPALAERLVGRRWHIELDLRLRADRMLIADAEWTLMQLPVVLSFAHVAGYEAQIGLDHPDVELVIELVRLGRAFVKLSDAARIPAQPGADLKPFVAAILAQRADRLVWGSGIRSERQPPQGTGPAPSTLDAWIDDSAARKAILSRNPALLYGFDTDN